MTAYLTCAYDPSVYFNLVQSMSDNEILLGGLGERHRTYTDHEFWAALRRKLEGPLQVVAPPQLGGDVEVSDEQIRAELTELTDGCQEFLRRGNGDADRTA